MLGTLPMYSVSYPQIMSSVFILFFDFINPNIKNMLKNKHFIQKFQGPSLEKIGEAELSSKAMLS